MGGGLRVDKMRKEEGSKMIGRRDTRDHVSAWTLGFSCNIVLFLIRLPALHLKLIN